MNEHDPTRSYGDQPAPPRSDMRAGVEPTVGSRSWQHDSTDLPSWRTLHDEHVGSSLGLRPLAAADPSTGSEGQVAHQTGLDRQVWVAVFDPADAAAHHRSETAAWAGARLEHPHVLPIHDRGRDYLVFQPPPDRSLADLMADDSAMGDRVERCIEVVLRACDALAYAHSRGIAHRALAPEAILIGDHGEVLVAGWDQAGTIGTPNGAAGMVDHAWAAPEQGDPAAAIGAADDVYALASIIAAVAGRQADELRDVCNRARSEESLARGDVTALAADLRAWRRHAAAQRRARDWCARALLLLGEMSGGDGERRAREAMALVQRADLLAGHLVDVHASHRRVASALVVRAVERGDLAQARVVCDRGGDVIDLAALDLLATAEERARRHRRALARLRRLALAAGILALAGCGLFLWYQEHEAGWFGERRRRAARAIVAMVDDNARDPVALSAGIAACEEALGLDAHAATASKLRRELLARAIRQACLHGRTGLAGAYLQRLAEDDAATETVNALRRAVERERAVHDPDPGRRRRLVAAVMRVDRAAALSRDAVRRHEAHWRRWVFDRSSARPAVFGQLLTSGNRALRLAGLRLLGRVDDRDAQSWQYALTGDAEPAVRIAALRSLARQRDQHWVHPVLRQRSDGHLLVDHHPDLFFFPSWKVAKVPDSVPGWIMKALVDERVALERQADAAGTISNDLRTRMRAVVRALLGPFANSGAARRCARPLCERLGLPVDATRGRLLQDWEDELRQQREQMAAGQLRAFIGAAAVLKRRGRDREAYDTLKRAAARFPDRADALARFLAVTALDAGLGEAVIEPHARLALERFDRGEDPHLDLSLVRICRGLGWVGESIRISRIHWQQDPNDADAAKLMVDNLLELEVAPEFVVRVMTRLLEAKPSDGRGRINRARALAQLGEHDKALADLEYACQRHPHNPEYHMWRGRVLEQQGRYWDALDAFTTGDAAKRYWDYLPVALEKGRMALRLGATGHALAAWTAVAERRPDAVAPTLLVLRLLLQEGAGPAAVRYLARRPAAVEQKAFSQAFELFFVADPQQRRNRLPGLAPAARPAALVAELCLLLAHGADGTLCLLLAHGADGTQLADLRADLQALGPDDFVGAFLAFFDAARVGDRSAAALALDAFCNAYGATFDAHTIGITGRLHAWRKALAEGESHPFACPQAPLADRETYRWQPMPPLRLDATALSELRRLWQAHVRANGYAQTSILHQRRPDDNADPRSLDQVLQDLLRRDERMRAAQATGEGRRPE